MPTDEGRSRAMGIDMEELPKNMRLSALADRCMSEINNYRRGEASSEQYCLKIFRRAILELIDSAWGLLLDRFQEFLLAAFPLILLLRSAYTLEWPQHLVE